MNVLFGRCGSRLWRSVSTSATTTSQTSPIIRCLSSSSTVSPNRRAFLRIGLTGAVVGAIVGTGYTIYEKNNPKDHLINEKEVIRVLDQIPDIIPIRRIRFPGNDYGLKLILFQYQTCPFCCKVRAFLDYYGIGYDVVEVDPVLRQSLKWSEYKKVPILVAKTSNGYQPLNDSSMIISALASYLKDPNSQTTLPEIVQYFPIINFTDDNGATKKEIMNKYFLMLSSEQYGEENEYNLNEERKWRKWADDELVHMLSPNVYRTTQEALQAFNWFSKVGEWETTFPCWERTLIIYIGASAMYLVGKRLKKRHNLKDDVRESLYDACNQWVKEIKSRGTQFLGGSRPNLADLAVYGILSSIEGCATFQDLLKQTAVSQWYFDMKRAVTHHEGANFVT